MRARRLLVLLVLGAFASGCYWTKKPGPRGTNLDPDQIPQSGEPIPDTRK